MKTRRISYLEKLNKILNYEGITVVLVAGGIIAQVGFMARLLMYFVIITIPYIFYLLWKGNRREWIWYFFASVGTASLPFLLVTGEAYALLKIGLNFLPLAAIFFYCWILRMQVREWIADEQFALDTTVKDILKKKRDS